MEFIGLCIKINELPEVEFQNEPTEYRSQKTLLVRDISADDIVKYISEKMGIDELSLKMKYCRKVTECRALCVLFIL